MRISVVGCGKLGFPVALTWAAAGHEVVGYDSSPTAKEILASLKYPHREECAQAMLESTTLRIVDSIDEAVAHGEIVFVAVQTPHGSQYEGTTRMPETRADFDYTALKSAVRSIADSAAAQKKHVTLVVISTVLPGTSAREILPILDGNKFVSYIYQPMFIAMGSVIPDAECPEFVLLGIDKSDARGIETARQFFLSMHAVEKLRFMAVASAELTKVSYNVFLGLKIVAANAVMEIAHKTDANVDEVTDALAKATDRVVSAKYMRGGMGDGGPCHSRDAIALSWLAQEIDLSYDLFGSMVKAREEQTAWLADLCLDRARERGLSSVVVLGKAYKRGTNLTVGSPATLLHNELVAYVSKYSDFAMPRLEQWDPHVDGPREPFAESAAFVVATDHDEFFSMEFPAGSVVIDPWGRMKDREGVEVVRVGRR